jgi:hypothetical protein
MDGSLLLNNRNWGEGELVKGRNKTLLNSGSVAPLKIELYW